MSAHSSFTLPPDRQLLGDLLHSLSQPLTSLRCSLELSIDEVADQQQRSVSAALQQTETVIEMIQLMRQYLDTDQPGERPAIALMPVLKSVADDLASIAAVRNVRLSLRGTCAASIRAAEPRLRVALQYLILALIEEQPHWSGITLLLTEDREGTVLRSRFSQRIVDPAESPSTNRREDFDSVRATIGRVRLGIAGRVLENAGAALEHDGASGFILRIPHSHDSAI